MQKQNNIKLLTDLAAKALETRKLIIETCSKNGGHLAPSLGVVDLTVALLQVFNLPEDKIIWDVGHQAYAYKILTDRKDSFPTLRALNGISGFPKRSESPYDFFGTGHGGTSISAALGLKEALKKKGENSKVIAVIGDGSMTSGLAFEAMNQAEAYGSNLITVLNDNDMFISTSVGALSTWFSRQLTGPKYNAWRNEIKGILHKLPPIFHGDKIIEIASKALDGSKSLLTPGMLFEGFGYQYVGPIDGHNMKEMIETFSDIKENSGPVLVHVVTKKGKGYAPAEENPRHFHGVGPFNIETGEPVKTNDTSFTKYLSDYLPPLFRREQKLVAITAAMPDGTGLQKLQNLMADRVYDVGMAEAHAVTFAAGLAAGGLIPMVAIYSTFLQRAYDSIVHDVALQNLPVIFLVDRAGIVGEDGSTHHGLFDIAYLRHIPNMTIMAPRDELEMARMIECAIKLSAPSAIRFPRGSGLGKKHYNRVSPAEYKKGEVLKKGAGDILAITVGITDIIAQNGSEALLKEGIDISIYDLKFIKPLPSDLFLFIKENKIKKLVIIEDGVISGGAGSAIVEESIRRKLDLKFELIGISDHFPTHGTQKEIREKEGLSARNFIETVKRFAKL